MKKLNPLILWPCVALAVLYVAAIFFRPLLPIDETRYMTVAWEMRLHDGWLAPLTMNFEPYHHKPPMLFWLINMFWSVFGIERWSGLIPLVLSSLAVVFLTVRLGRKLFPETQFDPMKTTLLFLGSIPFIIYSTLILFDLTLTVFVLSSLLALLAYADSRKFRYMILMGMLMGLGVLTKGPVAYLYVLFPAFLAPLWMSNFTRPVSWYGDVTASIILSILPICLWLVPVLLQADNHFAFWLVWEQTAGRVTGNFNAAHVRPFYFYLPLIPLMLAPWVLFPSFWRGVRGIDRQNSAVRFLACWIIPVFLSFSCISGKQPHYLVPLLPCIILGVSMVMKYVPILWLKQTVVLLIGLVFIGQGIAWFTIFRNYDLQPVASYVAKHQYHEWAYVRNYHGEVGFLAKLREPVTDVQPQDLDSWFEVHPEGKAIVRYKKPEDVDRFHQIMSMPYRGKQLGIFESRSAE